MTMRSFPLVRGGWLLVALAAAGCGDRTPPTYRVPGRAVYQDGKPVPGGGVEFAASLDGKTYNARGQIGPDGAFRVSTFRLGDGLVAGEHRVALFSLPDGGEGKPAGPPPIPPQYADYETSGLTATVTPETREIVLEITRGAKR